jgi:hypothetical protein
MGKVLWHFNLILHHVLINQATMAQRGRKNGSILTKEMGN